MWGTAGSRDRCHPCRRCPKTAAGRRRMERRGQCVGWGAVNGFVHELAPADRRNPVVPPGTPIYGPSQSHDKLDWFDPVNHNEGAIKIPTWDTDLRIVPLDRLGGPFPQNPSGNVRLAAFLVGRILPVCSLLAPGQPGPSTPKKFELILDRTLNTSGRATPRRHSARTAPPRRRPHTCRSPGGTARSRGRADTL